MDENASVNQNQNQAQNLQTMQLPNQNGAGSSAGQGGAATGVSGTDDIAQAVNEAMGVASNGRATSQPVAQASTQAQSVVQAQPAGMENLATNNAVAAAVTAENATSALGGVPAVQASAAPEVAMMAVPGAAVAAMATNLPTSNDVGIESLLEECIKHEASDLHIQVGLPPVLRIDGSLRPITTYPILSNEMVQKLVFSTLDEDQQKILVKDKEFDYSFAFGDLGRFRVNAFQEKGNMAAAFRLIPNNIKTVEDLGLPGVVTSFADFPRGLVLVTGPTGSGKSTTLYALIKKIKSEKINIVTLEDPVEYKMDGVNQIQVNVDAGLTFASGLRSILRQDPDVVMVGEIRDGETANLAVQAALTGHLVFSTLHTNSAAGILPRLLDMGIEPFLLASTLNTVIGQRLVRRVAAKRTSFQSNDMQTKQIKDVLGDLLPKTAEEVAKVSEDLGYPNLPLADAASYTLVKGVDDQSSPGGYAGRAGLYEAIDVNEDMQKMIVQRATAAEVMRVAKEHGTVTMRQDGMLKALSGITTVEEVNRVASDLA